MTSKAREELSKDAFCIDVLKTKLTSLRIVFTRIKKNCIYLLPKKNEKIFFSDRLKEKN